MAFDWDSNYSSDFFAVSILDATQVVLASATTGGDLSVYTTAPTTGTYYVRVQSDDYYSGDLYSITTSTVPTPPAETESNNSAPTANPVSSGNAIYGQLYSATDQDWFKIQATAGTTITVAFDWDSNYSSDFFAVSILDSTQVVLASAATGGEVVISTTASINGIYYVRVESSRYYSGDMYTLVTTYTQYTESICSPSELVLSDTTYNDTRSFSSEIRISTSGSLVAAVGSDLQLHAPEIKLAPGFSAQLGSKIKIFSVPVQCGAITQALSSASSIPSTQNDSYVASGTGTHGVIGNPNPHPLSFDELPNALLERFSTVGLGASDLADIQASSTSEHIVFSTPVALVPDDDNEQRDIYHYQNSNNSLWLVSRAWNGTTGNGESDQPRIDSWGEYIVYRSTADNLSWENDTNGVADIYLYSLLDDSNQRVSWSETGEEIDSPAAHPTLGGLELVIVYDREDDSGKRGIYGHDPALDQLAQRLDTTQCDAHYPILSADGRFLAHLCGEPTKPEACTVHFIDRDNGQNAIKPCPSNVERDYRLYFEEPATGIRWLPQVDIEGRQKARSTNPLLEVGNSNM